MFDGPMGLADGLLRLLAPTLGLTDHLRYFYIYSCRIGQPHDCCSANSMANQGNIAFMVHQSYELHKCCIIT